MNFFFIEKYDVVGQLLKPGQKPTVYPKDETTIDGNYTTNKKTE